MQGENDSITDRPLLVMQVDAFRGAAEAPPAMFVYQDRRSRPTGSGEMATGHMCTGSSAKAMETPELVFEVIPIGSIEWPQVRITTSLQLP